MKRNEPCRCGSGQKYKKCCLIKDEQERSAKIAAEVAQRAAAAPEAPAAEPDKKAPKSDGPRKFGGAASPFGGSGPKKAAKVTKHAV